MGDVTRFKTVLQNTHFERQARLFQDSLAFCDIFCDLYDALQIKFTLRRQGTYGSPTSAHRDETEVLNNSE
jgi:hypothetical protein